MSNQSLSVEPHRAEPQRPLLIVFDFDHTLINANSDLVPFQELPYGQPLVPRFTSLRKEQGLGWTQIMQSQLAELAAQEGYSKADVLACLRNLKMDPALVHALKTLQRSQSPPAKLVIASDANTIFINEILSANGIEDGTFCAVYTNHGSWSANDVVQVEPYQPSDTPHNCPRACPVNMCKSSILRRAMTELQLVDVKDLRTVYVGDGGNDFCPSLSLSAADLVLVREGFALQRLIEKAMAGAELEQTSASGLQHTSTQDATSSAETTAEHIPETKQAHTVSAEVKIWHTHQELGHLLLDVVGERPLVPKDAVNPNNSDPPLDTVTDSLSKMTISKGSHI